MDFCTMGEPMIKTGLPTMMQDLQKELRTFEQALLDGFEILELRLTLRFGVMLVIWVAVAALTLKPIRHSHSWLNCLF
jgi:hypothetical protein